MPPGDYKVRDKQQGFKVRRSLLTGMGAAAVGVVAAATANAQGSDVRKARHEKDRWLAELPGEHRVFIDTSYATGGMEALHYANNILTSNRNDYGGSDSDYAMVICWRHYAAPYGYKDETWARYGEIFSAVMGLEDPQTGKPYHVNPANIAGREDLDNGGDTIDKTLARGVRIAICNAATRWYAGYVADQVDGDAEAIYKSFVDSAVPNSHFVGAGVMATTRAQEYGFSLLSAG